MSDVARAVILVVGMFICVAIFLFLVVLVVQVINIKYFENIPIIVKVDNKIVYDGISAGVSIDSSGANTSVTISKPPLYILPKAHYISRDVEIINKGE
jgi:hypothetical protein